MKTFKDNAGRTWSIDINITSIKAVRAATNINLSELITNGETFIRFYDDPLLVSDVVYLLCKAQADEKQVSESDFASAIGGDVLDDASTALVTAVIEFSPAHKRTVMRETLAKYHKMHEAMVEKALALLAGDRIDKQVEQLLDKAAAGNHRSAGREIHTTIVQT